MAPCTMMCDSSATPIVVSTRNWGRKNPRLPGVWAPGIGLSTPTVQVVPGVALPPGSSLPRINGGRPRTNEYLFDGISVLQPEPGQVAFFPNIDAIQEFKIESNSPPAEFGRFNGGVVNLTTKSGSNAFRGTAFVFARNEALYRKGYQGLAYEIVINSNPCLVYIMEENSATMQTLVLAHAGFGHSHFFKNNYVFKQWTDANGILDYLEFARTYITNCEERYGVGEVERVLDSAHALQSHGVHRFPRKRMPDLRSEQVREEERRLHGEQLFNDLWRTVPAGKRKAGRDDDNRRKALLGIPEENLLYFMEKSAPRLQGWHREILRIVRLINPAAAITHEARERLTKKVYTNLRDEFTVRVAQGYVREVGRAAIDLYGGRLRALPDLPEAKTASQPSLSATPQSGFKWSRLARQAKNLGSAGASWVWKRRG